MTDRAIPSATAATVDRDKRWEEIQALSRKVASKDGAPTEIEAALCGAVVRARDWKEELDATKEIFAARANPPSVAPTITVPPHHPSCKPEDQSLVWECDQCGMVTHAEPSTPPSTAPSGFEEWADTIETDYPEVRLTRTRNMLFKAWQAARSTPPTTEQNTKELRGPEQPEKGYAPSGHESLTVCDVADKKPEGHCPACGRNWGGEAGELGPSRAEASPVTALLGSDDDPGFDNLVRGACDPECGGRCLRCPAEAIKEYVQQLRNMVSINGAASIANATRADIAEKKLATLAEQSNSLIGALSGANIDARRSSLIRLVREAIFTEIDRPWNFDDDEQRVAFADVVVSWIPNR